ncbi:MAG: cyclic nucleotide-binding domain-containing protein [Deltaproteobacteria bacterium]|nr:cyclic nucleotide-binding domain-containing protein [Deltaproteobacteria bacterium]
MSKRILSILKKSEIFSGLTDQELDEISALAEIEEYDEAEIIVFEGEVGDDLYLVLSGRVGVSAKLAGRSKKLAVLESGGIFGEIAPLRAHRRMATVVALQKVEVGRIPQKPLEIILDDFPLVKARLEDLGTTRMLENALAEIGDHSSQ